MTVHVGLCGTWSETLTTIFFLHRSSSEVHCPRFCCSVVSTGKVFNHKFLQVLFVNIFFISLAGHQGTVLVFK